MPFFGPFSLAGSTGNVPEIIQQLRLRLPALTAPASYPGRGGQGVGALGFTHPNAGLFEGAAGPPESVTQLLQMFPTPETAPPIPGPVPGAGGGMPIESALGGVPSGGGSRGDSGPAGLSAAPGAGAPGPGVGAGAGNVPGTPTGPGVGNSVGASVGGMVGGPVGAVAGGLLGMIADMGLSAGGITGMPGVTGTPPGLGEEGPSATGIAEAGVGVGAGGDGGK